MSQNGHAARPGDSRSETICSRFSGARRYPPWVKVFISWSGEPSRSIARALNDWLEGVLSQVEPWVSDEEIRSGARWGDVLAESLEETDYGVICVTRENQTAPWLIFEAGALSKKVESAKVVPLCIDLPPSDVFKGPLTPFQGRALNEAGIRRLVHDLNQDTEKPMTKERLTRSSTGHGRTSIQPSPKRSKRDLYRQSRNAR